MASYFVSTSKIWNAFLISKIEINNEWKNKIKIKNMKTIKDLKIIWKDEFRTLDFN
jgi:hypothetical protein